MTMKFTLALVGTAFLCAAASRAADTDFQFYPRNTNNSDQIDNSIQPLDSFQIMLGMKTPNQASSQELLSVEAEFSTDTINSDQITMRGHKPGKIALQIQTDSGNDLGQLIDLKLNPQAHGMLPIFISHVSDTMSPRDLNVPDYQKPRHVIP